MRSAVYVARNFNEDPTRPFFTYGTTTGAANPLDANDGDSGYAEVSASATLGESTAVTFRLEWFSGDIPPPSGVPGMYLTFDVGWRSTSGGEGSLEVVARPVITSWNPVYVYPSPTTYEIQTDLGWEDGKIRWGGDFGLETPTIDELLSGEAYWLLETSPAGSTIRVTYLRGRLYWPGDIPTRVYPRADGLGMGAPRIMDGRSPYRSARVFGQI